MNLLSFLEKYASDLKNYERRCIPLKLTDCKFLGKPFFPVDKKYPTDENGKPMIMIAQLNFEQIPDLSPFPTDGILQLFLSPDNWYDEDSAIIYHSKEELKLEPMIDFSFIKQEHYEELPIFKIHELSFKMKIDNGGSVDCQFDYQFNGKDYWDFVEQLTEEQEQSMGKYFDAAGHKIGGYAEFTQSDPRDYNTDHSDDIQVLQIDVDEHIMFGYSGLGHIFISKENLIKKDFSKAYFYWDCC